MIVTTLVDVGEIEENVSITHEDIVAAIVEDGGSTETVLRSINNFYQYMNAVPEEVINSASPQAKKIVRDFFSKQIKRFE